MVSVTVETDAPVRAVTPVLDLLRCPETGGPLVAVTGGRAGPGGRVYPLTPSGVPLFANASASTDARRQEAHYNAVASAYEANLRYPHTQAYLAHLDRAVLDAFGAQRVGTVAEICCGTGEAFTLLAGRYDRGIGVDISPVMLDRAVAVHREEPAVFVQGDATRLPLADAAFDMAVMLGGIHHVSGRAALFSEIIRILRPGGRFIYREPVSDFAIWRWLRAVIYRVSPMLDRETERPLTWAETVPVLARAGFEIESWKTFGFFGFCLFMNSDILVVNRLFRFIPGIAAIARAAARCDDWVLRLPGLAGAGLQVVGVARKPR